MKRESTEKKDKSISKKDKKSKLIYVAILVIGVNGLLMLNNSVSNRESKKETVNIAEVNSSGDIVINKSDISKHATFLTYNVDGIDVGLFAVLANDGSIRTALNTCQVCNGSPKAYFTQSGDKFQCENCKNLFDTNQIEQQSGGCNPVPITSDIKLETENEIIIPLEFLRDVAPYFKNWKTS